MLVAVDIETTGLIEKGQYPDILLITWASDEGSGYFTDINECKEFIEGKIPIFHNSSFDVPILRHHGVDIVNYHDSMLLSYCLDSYKPHSLAECGREVGFEKSFFDFKDFDGTVTEELLNYAVNDAIVTWEVWKKYSTIVDETTWNLYKQIELPYSSIIQQMQHCGMFFKLDDVYVMYQEIELEISKIYTNLEKLVGKVPDTKPKKYKKEHPELKDNFLGVDEEGNFLYQLYSDFNINSNDHKAYALKKLYGWQPEKKTKTGKDKINEEVLSELNYPLAKELVEVAKLNKVKTSFLTPIMNFQDDRGFVHGNFNQCVTRTGRLSSSNPNMQNLPSRGELGTKIRSLVCDDFHPDITIVGGDLSNIEARVLAYYLKRYEGDNTIANAFINDLDLHDVNAAAWELDRNTAKKVLYLTLYGGGANKLSVDIGISLEEAEAIINQVYSKLPALRRLKEKVVAMTKESGYIQTLFGRKIFYRDINSSNKWKRFRAERQCFNALLQGTAADILKVLSVSSIPTVRDYGAVFVAAVHDETLFYCDKQNADGFAQSLTDLWQSLSLLEDVPIKVDFKTGSNWGQIHS